jgi:hypothetical protein
VRAGHGRERWTSCWLEEEEGGAGWNFLGAVDQRAGRPGRRTRARRGLVAMAAGGQGESRGTGVLPGSSAMAALLGGGQGNCSLQGASAIAGSLVAAPGKMESTPWLLSACSRGARPASKQGGGGPRPWRRGPAGEGMSWALGCWAAMGGPCALAGVRGRRRQGGEAMAAGKKGGVGMQNSQGQGRGIRIYRETLGLGFQMGPIGLGWAGPNTKSGYIKLFPE